MKKKLLLLTLTILGAFAFTGCSKKSGTTKEKKKDHTEIDRNFKYEYVYDKESNTRTIICSEREDENSEYKLYRKYYTKYDEKDYVIENMYYTYQDGEWIGEEIIKNEYSDNHNKKRVITYLSFLDEDTGSRTWEYSGQTYYEYKDFNGEKLETICVYYEGGCDKEEDDVVDGKCMSTYDSKGLLIQEDNYSYLSSTNDWEYDTKTVITRPSSSQTIYTQYEVTKNGYVEKEKTAYTFDENDNLILEEEYEYINNEFVLTTKYVSDYENGKCMRQFYYSYEDGVELLYFKNERTYVDGFETSYINYEEEDGVLYPSCKDIYITDKFENEEFATYYIWNREAEDWVIA